jgi:hypothetical protein
MLSTQLEEGISDAAPNIPEKSDRRISHDRDGLAGHRAIA